MNVVLARHFGMCFGVRDALRATHALADRAPVTVLGELVHNPLVHDHLEQLGVRHGDLGALETAETRDVVITAHGASDRDRETWSRAGFRVSDTTCPLVRKAHERLRRLVAEGFHPVVIGCAGHVEVRGLTGDFPGADVVLTEEQVRSLPARPRFGVVSQTTQPIVRVRELVAVLRETHPESEVRFLDTVCQPTKDRQIALEDLCRECDTVVVVGGRQSNNTGELVKAAERLGASAYHVTGPEELQRRWFIRSRNVGVTAGTSTLDETVQQVFEALKAMG
ncbi:MAG TPA: 4-hydroxy-3-methylbut-2-enyl diphosphate reductase [Verrucomicrobiales bacterium]|nr:4-hydroxy-3-methylbut-2-enyl diphosphate reductase [Verrucomicrobiales bacterium]